MSNHKTLPNIDFRRVIKFTRTKSHLSIKIEGYLHQGLAGKFFTINSQSGNKFVVVKRAFFSRPDSSKTKIFITSFKSYTSDLIVF